MNNELTQHQKILTLMCRHRAQEWWLPHHFMTNNLGTLFVGYEASARMSELGKSYPEMIQTLPEGKYKKRRIRFESIHQWLPLLPSDLQAVFNQEVAEAIAPPEPIKPAEPPVQTLLVDVPAKPIERFF